jgi:uncharacterized BrkB/YihY/UPF0761 family membrane protein
MWSSGIGTGSHRGSIVGLCLWLLASLALRIYLHFFDTYTATYGSLGAVLVLLLWFYLTKLKGQKAPRAA